ncbi:MAG: Ig-like domain-containing protein [Lachnospiraceae bacterium]|nr:Ig-like domain-containing protein [Lachnospiraceae bacterium]
MKKRAWFGLMAGILMMGMSVGGEERTQIDRAEYEVLEKEETLALSAMTEEMDAVHSSGSLKEVLCEEERLIDPADDEGIEEYTASDGELLDLTREEPHLDGDLTDLIREEPFWDGELTDLITEEESGAEQAGTQLSASSYPHRATSTQKGVTLVVEWEEPVLGQPTTFHVSAENGTGVYKFYMWMPMYSSPGEKWSESVADVRKWKWKDYTQKCEAFDFDFTMMASGTYTCRFSVMEFTETGVNQVFNADMEIEVEDPAYPSVNDRAVAAVKTAREQTDGSDYQMALWLHDWLLDQLEYDGTFVWSSAESALTRGLGTCQAYTNAYMKLLSAAGIANTDIRDDADYHTWNAAKLDGKWVQIDCTWDDADPKYYSFDVRHLYFGLTDELMAIAHPGHAGIYSAAGYTTRSTTLEHQYFVRSGDAAAWAQTYAQQIREKLKVGEKEFVLPADNGKTPDGMAGILNGVTAYALSQMDWGLGDSGLRLAVTGDAAQFSFSVQSLSDQPPQPGDPEGDGTGDKPGTGGADQKPGGTGSGTSNSGNTPVVKTKITGIKAALTLARKKTYALKPRVSPVVPAGKIRYTSSDAKVAKVSNRGVVTALRPGKTVITVLAGNGRAACTVTVPGIAGVRSSVSLKKGKKLRLTPAVYGTKKKVKYTSSNPAVASVSSKGVIRARRKGTAVITVKAGVYTAKCKVRVKK